MRRLLPLLILLPFFAVAEPDVTFEELYQFGKNEYTQKHWTECVAYMKRAIEDFKFFESESIYCRERCSLQVEEPANNELSQRHAQAERALCLLRCRRDRLGWERPPLHSMHKYFDFVEKKPYHYLHICYWQLKDLKKAVSSAFTYLVRNPDDQEAVDNIRFYMEQDGFTEDMLVDEDRMDYETKFMSGVSAYNEEQWGQCIDHLEASLEKLLQEEKKCRMMCADKIDWSAQQSHPEFDVLSTSMHQSVLRCEHNCLSRLSVVNGHDFRNILASHFEYLHYCQFKMQRGSDACSSVANYLLFDQSPSMRRNKHHYMQLYKRKELFQPDQPVESGVLLVGNKMGFLDYDKRIADLFVRRELEKRVLDFVAEKFKYTNGELPPDQADDHKRLVEEVDMEDRFEYDKVETLLEASECRSLREGEPVDSAISRIRSLFPHHSFFSASCEQQQSAACHGALVLSTEESDCSTWLAAVHSGCSLVMCPEE